MCPRPKRKKLSFDEDSLNKFMQEIYDESHNTKAKITRLFTKWETQVKEPGEVQAIGDQIIKLIAAEAKNQDQRIQLLRYLKEIVFEKKGGGSGASSASSEETGDLSTDRKNELMEFVANELEQKDKTK